MKNILVIDGQGGKIGRELLELIKQRFPDGCIAAVGTNSTATATMMKGGPARAATGENAVIVACRTADIIVGPIGIVVADSLYGEITPAMAAAVGQSGAVKILIPVSRCETLVAGIRGLTLSELLKDALEKISETLCAQ
jgi:hypothetical protein